MKTRNLSPTHFPHATRGSHSLAVVIGLCFVLLLVALGLAGYAWHTTRSENARLQAQARKVETEKQAADITRQQAEVAQQKADEAAKLTTARNQQEAFALGARKLTNILESLLVAIPALHEQLEQLHSGEPGRKVAIHPDLVASARVLFEREVRDLPVREEAVQHLEALRRYLVQLAENANTTFQPSAEMNAALAESQLWVNTATRRVQATRALADSLVRDAQIKVPPLSATNSPPTLEIAFEQLAIQERSKYLAKETVAVGAAREAATNVILGVVTNTIALDADLERQRAEDEAKKKQAEADRETARKKAEIKEQELIAKAKTAEVQDVLATFLAKGNWQPKGGFSLKPEPISYSKLVQAGALTEDINGIRALASIATTPHDKARPRMSGRRPKYNKQSLDTYSEAQALLIELGPTLVKLGMLAP